MTSVGIGGGLGRQYVHVLGVCCCVLLNSHYLTMTLGIDAASDTVLY